MACSTLFRLVAAVLAIASAVVASPTKATDDSSCSAANGIKVQDARLLIVPDIATNSAKLTLSGRALIPDADKVPIEAAKALCSAAIGERFIVNQVEICGLFSLFSGQDTLKPNGGDVEFELSRSLSQQNHEVWINLHAGDGICADHLVVEVRAGLRGRFIVLSKTPKSLAVDRAEFELRPGARSQNLDIRLAVNQDPETALGDRPMIGPKSWGEPVECIRLQPIARALLLSLAIALLIMFFEKGHPFPSTFGSASQYLEAPVTTAMAFYMAGALTEFASNVAHWTFRPGNRTPFGWMRDALRDWPGIDPSISTELALIGILAIALAVHLLLGLPLRWLGPIGRALAFPLKVTFYAAAISVAGSVFAATVLLIETHIIWAGFEAPALAISLFYALIAVWALQRLFGLSRWWVIGITLLVAVTAFFPTDPVVTSSSPSGVSIGQNTAVWARFLCSPTADFIYIAALIGFAFRIAGSDELHDSLVSQWLIFLLILQIASFAIGNPTNAFAVAGVVLISSGWLLASPEGCSDIEVAGTEEAIGWELEEETFPFVVGGAAAFIFLIQFIFEAGGAGQSHKFALLGLAHVPRTFAMGAIAGLVLARVGPCLRGDSATLKSVNISGLILLANMAAVLVFLQGRERLIGVLANYLGVIASLILCSVFVYDLRRVNARDGRFEWRQIFEGTTLARGVPIVSAVAVALFSALSPIFIKEIGDAFGAFLRLALPHVPAGS